MELVLQPILLVKAWSRIGSLSHVRSWDAFHAALLSAGPFSSITKPDNDQAVVKRADDPRADGSSDVAVVHMSTGIGTAHVDMGLPNGRVASRAWARS